MRRLHERGVGKGCTTHQVVCRQIVLTQLAHLDLERLQRLFRALHARVELTEPLCAKNGQTSTRSRFRHVQKNNTSISRARTESCDRHKQETKGIRARLRSDRRAGPQNPTLRRRRCMHLCCSDRLELWHSTKASLNLRLQISELIIVKVDLLGHR